MCSAKRARRSAKNGVYGSQIVAYSGKNPRACANRVPLAFVAANKSSAQKDVFFTVAAQVKASGRSL